MKTTKTQKLTRITDDQARALKKGMKVRLMEDKYESKAGDIVTITKANYPGSDYENIRISNSQGSWRVSSYSLASL